MTSDTKRRWQRSEIIYCSNVHPGENLDEVLNIIQTDISAIRDHRHLDTMGIGLWLSFKAASEILSTDASLKYFSAFLAEHRINLQSINGFPFGDFHTESVKENVYLPNWSNPDRLDYTLKLAGILSHCMPPQQTEGTISTLPLGYKPLWDDDQHASALISLCNLSLELDKLRKKTGRSIRVCLEMEPGCVLEHTDEAINLFTSELPKTAHKQGIPLSVIRNHLGICFDICHQAVMFEDPEISLTRLLNAGIHVGKIQISSALEYQHDANNDISALQIFDEKRYLHQTFTKNGGKTYGVMDLPYAFNYLFFMSNSPWRIHYHVPVQLKTIDHNIHTTQSEIIKTFNFLQKNKQFHPCLEVETYTWHVLPEQVRSKSLQLTYNISQELAWVDTELSHRELLEK